MQGSSEMSTNSYLGIFLKFWLINCEDANCADWAELVLKAVMECKPALKSKAP